VNFQWPKVRAVNSFKVARQKKYAQIFINFEINKWNLSKKLKVGIVKIINPIQKYGKSNNSTLSFLMIWKTKTTKVNKTKRPILIVLFTLIYIYFYL